MMRKWLFILLSGTLIGSMQAQPKILFSRSLGGLNTGGTPDLMVYDVGTGETHLLLKGTVTRRGEYAAAISPDGLKLLSNTYIFGGWKLGIADMKDGKPGKFRRFTDRSNYEYNAKWSNDGQKVAYQEFNWTKRDVDIFIADADGKNIRQLTDVPGGDRMPEWTKDDDAIVFTSGRAGNYDIYFQPLESDEAINLTEHNSTDFAPSASGIADRIAFLSDRNGAVHLYSMMTDGSNQKNLTPELTSNVPGGDGFEDSGYWAYQTSWSKDGKHIVFCVLIGSDLELFIVDSNGNNLVQITDNNDSDFSPIWIR